MSFFEATLGKIARTYMHKHGLKVMMHATEADKCHLHHLMTVIIFIILHYHS